MIVEVGHHHHDHVSSVQNPCWLMISSGVILPIILGIITYYNNPIGDLYQPTSIPWNKLQTFDYKNTFDYRNNNPWFQEHCSCDYWSQATDIVANLSPTGEFQFAETQGCWRCHSERYIGPVAMNGGLSQDWGPSKKSNRCRRDACNWEGFFTI